MWFKQLQLFQLDKIIQTADELAGKLTSLAFTPCLPSMPFSIGWVSPIDEQDAEAPLVRALNNYMMICLQIEEKILPATVIRHELAKKIRQIETAEGRKVRQKEKLSLKDELIMTLLPRAFTKFSKIHAYIDKTRKQLILSTTNSKRIEQFLSLFKKSVDIDVQSLEVDKLSSLFTHWVKSQEYPTTFSIEKNGMLQDPNQQNRIIRCKQQDLFAPSIQSLIKDGCEVKQLGLMWQDRVTFVLLDNLTLQGIKFNDDILMQSKEMEPETKEQHFDADFLIMSGTFSLLLEDLLNLVSDAVAEKQQEVAAA